MTTLRALQRLMTVLLLLGTLLGGFFSFVRTWYRTWGASQAEAQRSLPGDEVIPDADPRSATTRALTIHAPIAAVWPWLAQLGQDRGGFYSFEVLEDLVGCEIENADRIHPEFQAWKPGDKLWMFPPSKLDGLGHAALVRHEAGRVLVFATRRIGSPSSRHDGSWAFILEPIDSTTTRFLVRSRAASGRSVLGSAFDQVVFEPVHFVMERKTMEGIKLRAEGGRGSKAADDAQVLLWTVTFALCVFAGVLAVRREQWQRPLAAFAAAAVAFQILTLVQPPIGVGIALVLAVAAILWLRVASGADRERSVAEAA